MHSTEELLKRLLEEREELQVKIAKLAAVTQDEKSRNSLNPKETQIMLEQLEDMRSYGRKLASRVTMAQRKLKEQEQEQEQDRYNFSTALHHLKHGSRIARKGWNGKGLYVVKVQGSNDLASLHGYGFGECAGEPHFTDTSFIHNTTTGEITSWVPSQSDMWAEDWYIMNK